MNTFLAIYLPGVLIMSGFIIGYYDTIKNDMEIKYPLLTSFIVIIFSWIGVGVIISDIMHNTYLDDDN